MRALLAALAVGLLVAPIPPSARAQAGERVLLALYYPWFSPHQFGPGQTSDVPAEPYESDDQVAIGRQIDQARAAGLDAFVVAWNGPGDRTDQNLGRVMAQAARRNFRVSVYVESHNFAGPSEMAAGLSYLLGTYGGQPSFLRKDGRPVLFFWRQQVFGPAAWAGIRGQVDPTWGTFWVAEGTTIDYFNAFDGLHLFNISWAANPSSPLDTWATRTRAASAVYGPRIFVPTIMPGYDDRAVRGGYARDREGGGYYQRTMEAAMATAPEWAVLLTSWNEWPEGTQIEPSVSYGDWYLHLTAQFAARLKKLARAGWADGT
jgi:hypothetical protein